MKGDLITIEGIDGSGKTTVTRALTEKLRNKVDREVVKTKEPTDNWLGQTVRKGLRKDVDSLAEAFLFTADHIEHVERVLKPNLKKGKLIVSDRYSDSFLAYQGTTLSEKKEIKEPIKYLKELRKDFTIKPDLTIFLDIKPKRGIERIGETNVKFEKIEFQKKVYKRFMKLIKKEKNRFIIIDASQKIEEIIDEILDSLSENLL